MKDAAEQISDLTALVKSFTLESGTETSLLAKLQAASNSFGKANVNPTCSDLTALINLCTAQMGKQITADQTARIIADATRVRGALDCRTP